MLQRLLGCHQSLKKPRIQVCLSQSRLVGKEIIEEKKSKTKQTKTKNYDPDVLETKIFVNQIKIFTSQAVSAHPSSRVFSCWLQKKQSPEGNEHLLMVDSHNIHIQPRVFFYFLLKIKGQIYFQTECEPSFIFKLCGFQNIGFSTFRNSSLKYSSFI